MSLEKLRYERNCQRAKRLSIIGALLGMITVASGADADHDLLPDEWELQHGLSVLSVDPQWIGFWPLVSGPLDQSGHQLNGSFTWDDGVQAWPYGHRPQAFSLNGAYTVPNDPANAQYLDISSGFRLSFWMAWPIIERPDPLLSFSQYTLASWSGTGGTSWTLEIDANGKARVVFANSQQIETLIATTSSPDLRYWNSYHRFDVTYNSTSGVVTLAIDGGAPASGTLSQWQPTTPQTFQFGAALNPETVLITDVRFLGNADLAQAHTFGDPDSDGVENWTEYAYGANPNLTDSDDDDLPDAWEITYGLNPANAADAYSDGDGDGLNAWGEYLFGSITSTDFDGDGILDGSEDSDGDGLADGWECQYRTDPFTDTREANPDNDGLSNWDEFLLGTNPNDPDSDNDEMTDGWEKQYGLNALSALDAGLDIDDDHLSNLFEFRNGSNPWPSFTYQSRGTIGWQNGGSGYEVDRGWVVDFNDNSQILYNHESMFSGPPCEAFVTGVGSIGHLGGYFTVGAAMNNAAQVVGGARDENGILRAFIWDSVLGIRALELPANAAGDSEAIAINNNGLVLGKYKDAAETDRYFLWQSGNVTEISISGVWSFEPEVLNDQNLIVGWLRDIAGDQVFTANATLSGGLSGITRYGAYSSWPRMHAVATTTTGTMLANADNTFGFDAVLINSSSLTYVRASTSSSISTNAEDIDERKNVVGGVMDGTGHFRGYLYRDGCALDLSAVIGQGISRAVKINSFGQILTETETFITIWDEGQQAYRDISSGQSMGVLMRVSQDQDGDGMSNDWEDFYGFNKNDPADGSLSADFDGDGVSNRQEYLNGTDPKDYYNGLRPTLAKQSGDSQVGVAGTVLPAPLVVRVSSVSGTLSNAPVQFQMLNTNALLSTAADGSNPQAALSLRTDASGEAKVYVVLPTDINASTSIQVSAGPPNDLTTISFSASTNGSSIRVYKYDAIGRLIEAKQPRRNTIGITPDPNGNILNVNVSAQ